MEKRSQIIKELPLKMYSSVEDYLNAYRFENENVEDAEKHILEQSDKIDIVKRKLRSMYTIEELSDDEIDVLMDYQTEKCMKYKPNARIIDPHKDTIAILDEIDNDGNFFHNMLAIGKLVKFDTTNQKISFALKYKGCKIWNELLKRVEKNEIDEAVIFKLKKLNQVNAKVKGDISLNDIIQWDGELTSLAFDSTVDSSELTGRASQQDNFNVSFYKYNEEVIRITPEGDLFYASVDASVEGKGHPIVAYEMYSSEIDIPEDAKKGNGFEIYQKAAQKLKNITILGAGESPMLYLPEDLSDDQKKVLYKLLFNCNSELFNIFVVFIDENGELTEPLCVNENGALPKQGGVDNFIDMYLGRYNKEEINGYQEIDFYSKNARNKAETELQKRENELEWLENEAKRISVEEKTRSGIGIAVGI